MENLDCTQLERSYYLSQIEAAEAAKSAAKAAWWTFGFVAAGFLVTLATLLVSLPWRKVRTGEIFPLI